jgi:hypothetical protein
MIYTNTYRQGDLAGLLVRLPSSDLCPFRGEGLQVVAAWSINDQNSSPCKIRDLTRERLGIFAKWCFRDS